ncbi:MAG: MBL fold metallo-hydrolase [bacterium]
MKITLLTENAVGGTNWQTCLAEWGLSLLIEFNGKRILFDTGITDIYLKNAAVLGIDLENIDAVVLSHHDLDHIGGLKFLQPQEKKLLVTHPRVIATLKENSSDLTNYQISASREALEFLPDIYFLGEIPRITNFESGKANNDPMPDDTALAIKTKYGVIVITGCSHAGICNICETAKKVSGQNLYAVIGGFHLLKNDLQLIDQTITYFKAEKPQYICPIHCIGTPALVRFSQELKIKKVGSGDYIELKA